MEVNAPLRRVFDSLYNAGLALVIVYALPIAVILCLGMLGVIIQLVTTGEINPPGHNGLGNCYSFADSNCYAPINSNMFWIVLNTSFTRLTFLISLAVFMLSMSGKLESMSGKLEIEEQIKMSEKETEKETEEVLHEAAQKAIVELVGIMSDTLSVRAKKTRMQQIIEDLQERVNG